MTSSTGGADDNEAQAGHLIISPASQPASQPARALLSKQRDDGESEDFVVTLSVNHRQDPIYADETSLPLDTDHSVIYNPSRTLQKDGSVVERFKPDEVVDALHGPTGNKEPLVSDVEVRRLTPLERERLMGFPDGWTEGVSDAARNAQTGNAVVVPVAEWIARRIAGVSTGSKENE